MPRKSNVSQVSATGEDGTPAKEKDGVNIEVSIDTYIESTLLLFIPKQRVCILVIVNIIIIH